MELLDFLEDQGLLGDIRMRLGADNEKETKYDSQIMEMNAKELVAKYIGWNLGDESWATLAIGLYENIKQFNDKL